MRIGVTGTSSEIGIAVRMHANAEGHTVIGLSRRPDDRHFDVRQALDPAALADLDAVIHLAWDRSWHPEDSADSNIAGSRRLFEACADAGIPAVFLSSSSAAKPAKSRYGAAKLAVESQAAQLGVPSLRAGLIWGGGLPPIIRTLESIATLPMVLPLPAPSMALDHNHVSHVAGALLASLTGDTGTSMCRSVASPEFVTSSEVLKALRGGRKAMQIPIPARLVARTARRVRDAGLLRDPRLDSISLLDTTVSELSFDPQYPQYLGKHAFLEWLSHPKVSVGR